MTDDKSNLSNYSPISVLSCFPKVLERIICNPLYQYLTENKILYPKQFGFQTGHSTEHAIVQLVYQILESYEHNKYVLGVFIDLSKAFVWKPRRVDWFFFIKSKFIVWNWNLFSKKSKFISWNRNLFYPIEIYLLNRGFLIK